MEALYPASYLLDSSLFMAAKGREEWSREENKAFERALAMVDEATPDRWFRVAEMIPGRSVSDVITQYQELVADVNSIEAGLVPVPGYLASSLTFDLMGNRGFDTRIRKRGRSSSIDQERRKGVPWTEEEHRRFLMGLQAFGKGDWRNISRKFVMSKTPTQVASHAQKYFLRQHSGGKDKKRPSIHDITTVNLLNVNAPFQDAKSCASFAAAKPANNESKIWLDEWKDSNEELLIDIDSIGALHDRNYGANHCIANSKFHIQPRKYVL